MSQYMYELNYNPSRKDRSMAILYLMKRSCNPHH